MQNIRESELPKQKFQYRKWRDPAAVVNCENGLKYGKA
jgi:hypothetical protein